MGPVGPAIIEGQQDMGKQAIWGMLGQDGGQGAGPQLSLYRVGLGWMLPYWAQLMVLVRQKS